MLRDSVAAAVVVVRTRPRAIPLAMITMKKSTHGFPFLFHDEYGAPLGGPSGRWSSAIKPSEKITFKLRVIMTVNAEGGNLKCTISLTA